MKQVRFSRDAEKVIDRLDPKTRERILRGISDYASAGIGDVKRLQGRHDEYRLRIGSYRVIFTYENEQFVIVVLKIGSRGDVYKA